MKAVRIGIVFDTNMGWARGEVRGVIAYARDHRLPWVFAGGAATPATWRLFRRWKPHGLVVDDGWREEVRRLDVPMVASLIPEPAGSAVLDNDGIGRAAGEHLLARGFRHLAFVGAREMPWAAERGNGFRAKWREVVGGRPDASFHRLDLRSEAVMDWRPGRAELAAWLCGLPKPAGILACRDLRAREVVDVCRTLRLRVPEDVAVVGVDNDDLVCDLSDPPLSSVRVPWEQIGCHMGAHLRQRLQGEGRPWSPPLVRGGDVAVRRSSDTYAVSDEAVAQACRHIQEHAAERLSVAAIASAISLSRRGLERRFRRQLARSPRQVIEQVRLRMAQQLLRDTAIPVAVVSEKSGFGSHQRLIAVFRRFAGQTPGAYRARHQPRR